MKFLKTIFLVTAMTSIVGVQSCNILDQLGNLDTNITLPVTTTYTPSLQDPAQAFNVGKTVFNVLIKDQNGTATPGLAVEAAPEMDMGMMGTHGTPVESIIDNSDGSYTITAYFLMAGDWTLHFHVNADHLTDHLAFTVGGSMMDRGRLDGISDMTTYWMASHNRPYNIFISSIAANSVDLYLTAWESEMSIVPVYNGQTLHTDSMLASTAWNVGTVDLRICTTAGTWNSGTDLTTSSDDTYTCGGWTSLTDMGNGHYTASGITIVDTHNPADMMMTAPKIAVSLNVANGMISEWKTSDTANHIAGTQDGNDTTELTHINQ